MDVDNEIEEQIHWTVEELESFLGKDLTKEKLISLASDMEFDSNKNKETNYTNEIIEKEIEKAIEMKISQLNFSEKVMESFPISISNIATLCSLILKKCSISHIPDLSPDSLPLLKTVILSANKLENFPSGICLPSIEIMDLDHNQILEILVEPLLRMNKLKELKMFGNKLKSVPDQIKTLKMLTKLDLECNYIKKINFGKEDFVLGENMILLLDPTVKKQSKSIKRKKENELTKNKKLKKP